MIEITEKNGAVTFRIHAQPRAAKTEIVGEYGQALKIKLAAPPVDGKANAECRKFFAKLFHIPIQSVDILAGDSGRDKIIRLHQVNKQQAQEILNR
ncbi:MAG: DUF167 domain-containing protein [Acidobacteriota bacterium]